MPAECAPRPWGHVRPWQGEGTGTGGEQGQNAVDGEEKDCAAMCVEPVVCPAHVEKSAVPILKFSRFLVGGAGPVSRTRGDTPAPP